MLGNSGQHLYVNRLGGLETIRRCDLDGNGYLDLMFNCTHDRYCAVRAVLATAGAGHIDQNSLYDRLPPC